ncbi:MAG: ribonuclease III [SAR324 cluster bacterium]|jgi:ribonuclease-3|nr:ribonuclease III [Pseudomonadota bacterium]MBI12694.1 ribonuclease III [Deltaproteobacteria bacterium]MDP6090412.1 ribonuclease III [SAR324 cluster bacterium]MBP44401.1 ribonuclease III [Deltaproteobacteria bacterium]MDP6249034.1 ribonuclease III [SAR324 cluster bacterium]|tara:strand:- start:4855 stop:5580 length:726 start_codon:yes stop_codon:yes gene_type:complete
MENHFDKGCQRLCDQIDYQFRDEELLELALTHKSFTEFESKTGERNNEKLEFLGDAVLDMAISELLMERFPELDEGGLSKFRASLVNEDGLAHIARKMKLGDSLRMGRGEDLSGGREKPSLLADALEAVLAAIYLDSRKTEGFSRVSIIIYELYHEELPEQVDSFISRDYKSELQEFVQKNLNLPANYELVNQFGPDHQKEFEMVVKVEERILGRGRGFSKKQAGQAAAQDALNRLQSPHA